MKDYHQINNDVDQKQLKETDTFRELSLEELDKITGGLIYLEKRRSIHSKTRDRLPNM